MSRKSDARPWVIPERCEGCGSCVDACKRELLSMIETAQPQVFVPWLDEVDECTGCGQCETACIWGAICLTSYVEEARHRFLKNRPPAPVRDGTNLVQPEL